MCPADGGNCWPYKGPDGGFYCMKCNGRMW